MASGWAKDGAVQEQIDADVADAVARVRSRMAQGPSLTHCEECEEPIPEKRSAAIPGVRLCVECQSELDSDQVAYTAYNRKGSKGSQMR